MRLMGTDDSALYVGKSERHSPKGLIEGFTRPDCYHSLFSDLHAENRIVEGCQVRDIDTIDSELRLVAALRRAPRGRGGPLPSIDVADALLDEPLRPHAELHVGRPARSLLS